MLWLIIPLLTWVVYILFFKKQTAAAGGAREVVKDFKPKKVLSDAAERFRKTFSLDETNKPICISLRKDDLETSALALQSLLKTLIELADIYLIFCAQTDEDEQQILARIHILYREFPAHRCLFFSSSIGKVAIIRQVIPSLLIDHDRTFCDKLKPHVKRIIWVDSSISTSSADIVGPVQRGQLNTESTYPTVDKCGSEGSASNTAPPSGSAVGFPTVQSLNDILNIS